MRMPLLLAGIVMAGLWAAPAHGQDDDPPLQGKRLSEWLVLLRGENEAPLRDKTLVVLGGTARPLVQELLYRNRLRGLIATGLIGPLKSRKVFPALLDALRDDPDPRIRSGAAQALGRTAPKAKEKQQRLTEVRDGLITALRTDKAASVRSASATALGVFESDKERDFHLVFELTPALPVLVAALKDSSAEVSSSAAETIRRLGPDARDVVLDLSKVLEDPKADPLTRATLAKALGPIGTPESLAALPTMKAVLKDGQAPLDVRRAVAESLGKMGKDVAETVPLLGELLTAAGSPVELRRSVAGALDELAAEAKPAVPALKKALKDEDKFVRCLAMHCLGQIGKDLGADTKDVVTALLGALDDRVIEVRVAALETLANMGQEALGGDARIVEERMDKMTRDGLKEVRAAAENALKKLKMTP